MKKQLKKEKIVDGKIIGKISRKTGERKEGIIDEKKKMDRKINGKIDGKIDRRINVIT